MIFAPYSTEVEITRFPTGNVALIAGSVVLFLLCAFGFVGEGLAEQLVLDGWSPLGLLGHQFMHADLVHLLGNMLFLWAFGNAVCETMGSLRYVLTYLAAGLLAASVHNVLDGSLAVGASGAINGVIGFYLVLFPINRVHCFYWVFFKFGTVTVTGFWLILLWFVLDACGALSGFNTGTAYWAHLGGLFSGVALGLLYERKGWAKLAYYDNPNLVDLLIRRKSAPPIARPRKTRADPIREHQEEEAAAAAAVVPVAGDVIETPCPHCRAALAIPLDRPGASIRCPACQGEIAIEEAG